MDREFLEFGCRHGQRGAAANGKFERPGSKLSYGPDQDFDTQHIFLDLDLDVKQKTLSGSSSITLKAIVNGAKEMIFHAARMQILSIKDELGKTLTYKLVQDNLIVKLSRALKEDQETTVTIFYKVKNPIAGLYFIQPDKAYPKKPEHIWTHGETEESRYWFPCFDAPQDKASTELRVRVPKDFFALSNGALVSTEKDIKTGKKIYHWKQNIPHSPYLISLVAGKFSEIKDRWRDVPVNYYCQPGREDEVKRAFGKTPAMMEFFSQKIGVAYPYEKYSQIAVADFVMGGMEHTTATTQTDRVLMDARAYPEFTADWLVSHELAHQWFGDLLTCKEWAHAWLNESFATYFEALFIEHDLGRDEFLQEMQDKLAIYLDEDRNTYRRAIVTNKYTKPDDLFDRHLYEKGACVLHMLRRLLGDELFWKSIHVYVKNNFGKAVETTDLINAIQEATGRNMREFFDQWVYGAAHPDYVVHYWWDEKSKTANVQVAQKEISGGKVFSAEIDFLFVSEEGEKIETEIINKKRQSFSYKFAKEPKDFRFDPEFSILKVSALHKPYVMWAYQLAHDTNPIGRQRAAKELAKTETLQTVELLAAAFKKEKFWGSAKAMAQAIGTISLPQSRKYLLQFLSHKNPKVRRAVAETLSRFKDKEVYRNLTLVFSKDESYFVRASALKAIARVAPEQALPWIKKALTIPSWNDTIASAAAASLSRVPSAQVHKLVLDLTAYGKSPSVRASALSVLSFLSHKFPDLFNVLESLTQDPYLRIRHSAINALGNLKHPRAIAALEKVAQDQNLHYRTTSLAQDAILKIDSDYKI